MANVDPTRLEVPGGAYSYHWTPITNANADGTPIEAPGHSDKSFHIFGTPDSATVSMQGSNELTPTNWFTLTDENGDAISFTSGFPVGGMISPNVRWVRPHTTGGSGAQSLTVIVLGKGKR